MIDSFGDFRQRRDDFARGGLDLGDFGADLFGRFSGLRRQRLNFGGDHRKAAPGLPSARGFDGSVEREKIGLRRDIGDHGDNVTDLVGRSGQRIDGCARGIGARDCFAAQTAAAPRLFGNLGDRPDHLAAQLARGLIHGVRTFGGANGFVERRAHGIQRRQHVLGLEMQGGGAIDDRLDTGFCRGLDMACQVGQIGAARGLPRAVKIVMHQFAALPRWSCFRCFISLSCGCGS
jgi:hypothetical protein